MHACLLSVCMLKEFQPSRSRLIQKQIYLDVNSAFIVNLINRAPIPPCEADFTHIGHFWHLYLGFHPICFVTMTVWQRIGGRAITYSWVHELSYICQRTWKQIVAVCLFVFFLFECILVMKFYSKWSKTTQSTNVPLLKKEMDESWSYSSSPWKRTCSNWI